MLAAALQRHFLASRLSKRRGRTERMKSTVRSSLGTRAGDGVGLRKHNLGMAALLFATR